MANSTVALVVEVDGKPALVTLEQLRAGFKFVGKDAATMAAQVSNAMKIINQAAVTQAQGLVASGQAAMLMAKNAQAAGHAAATSGRQAATASRGWHALQTSFNVTNTAAQRLSRSLLSFRGLFTFFTGAGAFGIAAAGMINLANSFQLAGARLALVNKDFTSNMQLQRDLFAIAQAGRTEYEDTANLFVRLAGAAQKLGASYQQMLQFTDSVNKAFLISGTTAKEATNALVQLGQVLSSNRFQGDELRGIFENFPGFVRALEIGSGMTRDELRKLASEGKISAQEIINWMGKARSFLEEQARQIPVTFSQAITQLRNDWGSFLQALDKNVGATTGVNTAIQRIRDTLKDPAFLTAVTQWTDKLFRFFEFLVRNAETIIRVALSLKAVAVAFSIPIPGPWGLVIKALAALGAVLGVNVFVDSLSGADQLKTRLEEINAQISKLEQIQPFKTTERITMGRGMTKEVPIEGLLPPNPGYQFAQQQLRKLEAERERIMAQIAAQANVPNALLASGGLTDFSGADLLAEKTASEELSKAARNRIRDLEIEAELTEELARARQHSVAQYEITLDKQEAERIIMELGIEAHSQMADKIRELVLRRQEAQDSIDAENAALEDQLEIYSTLDEVKKAAITTEEQFASATEKLTKRLKELNEQFQFGRGELGPEAYKKAIEAAQREALDAQPIFVDLKEAGMEAGRAIADAFFSAASGASTFSEAISDLGKQVLDLLYNLLIIQPLMRELEDFFYNQAGATGNPTSQLLNFGGENPSNGLFDLIGGGLSLLGSLFGFGGGYAAGIPGVGPGGMGFTHFGGPRAAGGPVRHGMAYLVGEEGPELFMPHKAGTIIPHRANGGMVDALSPYLVGERGGELYVPADLQNLGRGADRWMGGRSVVNNFNITTPDANSFRASQGQIMSQAARAMGKTTRRDV